VEMPAPLASIDISRGHASFDRGSLGRAPCSGANVRRLPFHQAAIAFSISMKLGVRIFVAQDGNGGAE
jgi:hypothetical protein